MVRPSDDDAAVRWRRIVDFYVGFAKMQFWEFLHPMIGLTERVAVAPVASGLYPFTSHASLCVSLTPGYNPDVPFFSVSVGAGAVFQFEFWDRVGALRHKVACPPDDSFRVFCEFVSQLEACGPEDWDYD